MTYVFVGSVTEVIGAGIKLTRFGQRIELSGELAEGTRKHGGIPAIPEDQFEIIGFTAEELARQSPTDEDFQNKKRRALQILGDIRESE